MDRSSRRFARERKTIEAMVAVYCRSVHRRESPLCDDCAELVDYALMRLEKCSFGDDKPSCAICPIHCYKPAMRERIRAVMRYAGPRMLRSHPLLALRHLSQRFGRRTASAARKEAKG